MGGQVGDGDQLITAAPEHPSTRAPEHPTVIVGGGPHRAGRNVRRVGEAVEVAAFDGVGHIRQIHARSPAHVSDSK